MTDRPNPEGERTLRSSSGPIVLGLCGVIALFLLGDAVVRGGWAQMLLLAPWMLLALWIVYEISVVSRIRLDDSGALVQNMLRRTSFGWQRVRDIDLRWQLEFTLDDGTRVSSYGGPARARPRPTRSHEGEAAKAPAGLRELTAIRDQWQAAPTNADAPISRTWDIPALIALGAILVWAVAAILIVNG